MKAVIHYFSATGNTARAAGLVEERLKEAGLPLTPWEKPRENVDIWRKYGREVLNASAR